MYQSQLDPEKKLEFPYDARRKYNQAEKFTSIDWVEFPYKERALDKLMALDDRLTRFEAAGALLLSYGDFHVASQKITLCTDRSVWKTFEARFHEEKTAFYKAKKEHFAAETARIRQRFKSEKQRSFKDAQVEKQSSVIHRVKRYENGNKYDGHVLLRDGQIIPHGIGTIWVPAVDNAQANKYASKKVRYYEGSWKNGKMHGRGRIWWKNSGESWEGNFVSDDLHGPGRFYTKEECRKILEAEDRASLETASDDDNDTSTVEDARDVHSRIRYFHYSNHVCWASDLVPGIRIGFLTNEAAATNKCSIRNSSTINTVFDVKKVGTLIEYKPKTFKARVEFDEAERISEWMDLSRYPFKIPKNKLPMTYYITN